MSLVYGVIDLQCAVNGDSDVALHQHRGLHLRTLLRIMISAHYYVLLQIDTTLRRREQLRDLHGSEHDVDAQAGLRRLRSDGNGGRLRLREVASMKLVEEVGNFLGEV